MTTAAANDFVNHVGTSTLPALYHDSIRRSISNTANGPAHFQIGVVPVMVTSDHRAALRDFKSLYVGFEQRCPSDQAVEIEVVRTHRRFGIVSRYEVRSRGAHRFTVWRNRSVLPHIEWAINWEIMLHLPRYYQIHAGVVEIDGRGVIFPAPPGSGKTTMTAALVAGGWRYLSDEFALIDPDTLLLQPYPKAMCVKQGSFDALGQLGLLNGRPRIYQKGKKGSVTFISPYSLRPNAIGTPCPVGHVIFCRYEPNRRPAIVEIPRADAVLRLTQQSFNCLKFRSRGAEILTNVVRGARCYELTSGPLIETRELVERTVRSC